ncbi:MAG: penicillin-binding protein [Comamonadaceae bacterium]|nr:MAG: penicillin-binding protein [Comamonadaceae bacterium]
MTETALRLRLLAAAAWQRLRHPTPRGIALAVAAVPLMVLLYVLALIPLTPSIGDLRKVKTEAPALVMSADGKELAEFRRINRDWVKLAQIAPTVLSALIATEDHRFYDHHGIDLRRTAGAALRTFGGDRQGGSTITQQLARNLYPDSIGRAPTLTRKLKEAITALKIESVYTKEEILETYLNTVPFLYNAYGIEVAARTYFDKSAGQLQVLESATLIGMLKGTAYYNPVLNPQRALQRRNIVMGQMVKHGELAPAQFEALKKAPLDIEFERQNEALGPAPHLTQQLRRWLIEWADRNNYNIHADGLVVRTTIDSRLQALANQAVARQADRLQVLANAAWGPRSGFSPNRDVVQAFARETPQYRDAVAAGTPQAQALKQVLADAAVMQALREEKTRLQAGFLALDPRNGHVLAWVGSRQFQQDQFDHVAQARRQPGSTFKPFVYGAAFEQGISPNETFMDEPVEIPLGAGGAVWRPTDAGEPSGAPMTLRDGLAYSKNIITAQLVQRIGPAPVATLARALGVRQSKLDEVPSLALGTSPVTLKEMVVAYSTIANEGGYIEPVMVTRIEDRHGRVLEDFRPAAAQAAMSSAGAQTLLDVLRGAIDRGTGAGIRSRWGIQADVAGKTGTTQDNTDGWFILMHPQLVAGAWVGFNDNRVTMQDGWGQGARSALPMVGEFFQMALRAKVIDAKARFAAPSQPAPAPAPAPEPEPEAAWPNGLQEPPAPPAEQMVLPQPGLPPQLVVPPPAAQSAEQAVAPRPAAPQAIIVQRPVPGGPSPERGVRILSIPAQGFGAPPEAPAQGER